MNLHFALRERIAAEFGGRLDGEIVLKQDALMASFDTGVVLELRYLNPNEYAIQWLWGEAELRIDTAPLHRELATFPNHLHDAEGQVRADRLTVPGKDPWENVQCVLRVVLEDPLLGAAEESQRNPVGPEL